VAALLNEPTGQNAGDGFSPEASEDEIRHSPDLGGDQMIKIREIRYFKVESDDWCEIDIILYSNMFFIYGPRSCG
jgi:hypothetical protein